MIRKILILLMLTGVFSAHAQVEVFQGFVLDTLTTAQLDALPAKVKIKGAHFYNKDVSSLVGWNGTAWVAIGGTIPDGSITEAKLNTSVNASLDLADSSVQPADLSDYVDKTSNETIGGEKTFTGQTYIGSSPSDNNKLRLGYMSTPSLSAAAGSNYGMMYFQTDGNLTFSNGGAAGSGNVEFDWNANTAHRTYTLPDASGTIALTSDIGASGDLWSDPVDADVVPDGLTRSLGSSTNYFVNAFLDNIRAYTPNPIIDMRDTNNANNEGFRFGPTANGQDFLLEFLDDLNGVTSTYTINASGTPSAATDLIHLDYFQNNAGTDDQTLSLSGTGNKDLTISGTGGNTVTLPVLANSNQFIGTADRVIDIDPTGSIEITRGQSRRLLIDGNGNTELLLPSDPYDAGWNGLYQPASKADVYTQIESLGSGSYPSTAQKYYIIGPSTSHTMSDADFAAGAEYKSVKYESIDTLQVAALTNATHGRKPFLVNPWDKDSTYIKKPVGVDFYVPGQMAAITGDGLIVKNRHTATGEQVDATTMLFSGELTVHTEVTAIEAFGFDYDFNANGLSLGSLASWSNSGGGLATEAAQATGGEQPTVIDESGIRAVQFDGVDDNLEITSQTDLNPVIGTDSGTIIVVVGADNGTDGTWFGDRNTVRNINIGLSNSATQTIIQIGEGAQIFDGITPSGAYIYEVSFDATTIDTYLNGAAEISGNTTIGSDQAQQPFHIGRRVNGDEPFDGSIRRILVKFGAQLTPAERTAIVAQLTAENL
jgi:hypothetical protein